MKKCPHCGEPLDKATNACPNCGKIPQPKKSLPLWIILVTALVVVIVLAAVLLLLKPKNDVHTDPVAASEDITAQSIPEPTTEATTEATAEASTEPATDPTEPADPDAVYTNPLTGEVLDAPYSGRIFITSISNTPEVLPHVNAMKADILFESFVSDSIIRCWGLFSDITEIDRIGPVRSTRLMINDVAALYDAVLLHAGGKDKVLKDLKDRDIDNIRLDTWDALTYGASVRDEDRLDHVGYEHSLLVLGDKIDDYAKDLKIGLEGDPEKDYRLRFAEDGTPAGGEAATHIVYRINHRDMWKETILDYDAELGKYVYSQYGEVMIDGDSGEKEAYTNVILMNAIVNRSGAFQVADFLAGGDGYYACGGKIIPIRWGCDGEGQPLWFTTEDGQPLEMGVGNTYIAITDSTKGLIYE